MVNTIDLDKQGQIKGGLTKSDILKKYGNSAWRVMTILGLLVSSSCSVTEAQNTTSKPAETAPVPGANEPQLAMQPFEINKEYPEALQPYVDVFKNMATKDKLDLNLINNFDFILARDPAKGTTVEYALMPMAVVNGLTDPDNEPANQKPVYYLAYKDEQGQVIGNYVLGRLLEQDSEGNVSYVSRILADASFQDWLNNTQPVGSQIDLGQIVYATALANGIDIKEARKIEQQLTGGELSSADFMKQYALGVSFIQPGQVARQVTIVNPLMPDNTPVEPSIVPSFWSRLFGVQPALAAGLELEATATAPGSTPIIEPTSSAEPTPTIEPTLSAEQQQQVIMNQFVNEPFYDQYIADNQIPEQAATAFYKEYPGADGEPFAVVTMKVDPNSLSEEQKALNILQRDYLVVKTTDGKIEFKLLPVNLQLETFSKSAVEFTLSKEYQNWLEKNLNIMKQTPESTNISLKLQTGINNEIYSLMIIQLNDSSFNAFPFAIATQGQSGFWRWQEATLSRLGKMKDMDIGAFFGGNNVNMEEFRQILEIIQSEFSIAGIYTGMDIQLPQEGKSGLDIIEWPIQESGRSNLGMFLHPLVWHVSTPDWVKNKDTIGQLEAIEQYITEVAGFAENNHKEGQTFVINVVNEASGPNDFLYKTHGFEYIRRSFEAARKAAPSATLIYNDFANHTFTGQNYNRTKTIVEQLKKDNLIDGVGIEFTIEGADPPSKEEVIKALRSYELPVYITEFAVNMRDVYGTPEQRERIQANIYRLMMEAAIESGVCKMFMNFQLGDRFSVWENSPGLSGNSPKADATPYNDDLTPKEALIGQKAAFVDAP